MSEIDRRFRKWQAAVEKFETAAPLSHEEYLDLVDQREALHEAVAHHPQPPGLTEVDARFRAATEEVAECVWGVQVGIENCWTPQKHWWYFRGQSNR